MRRLIYTSKSLLGADTERLSALVERSSALNRTAGITGMLWSEGTHFVQVLEGGHDEIEFTMARIYKDERHTGIEVIEDRLAAARIFGSWGMKMHDAGQDCIGNTAFLVGFALNRPSPAAKRMLDVLIASEG